MNIDFSKLPSSIKEFYTQEEYAEMPEYERMHLSRMRQNFEALKSFGLKPPPPEFMLRKKAAVKSFKMPVTQRRRRDFSSEDSDSDEEWIPGCEDKTEGRAKPFIPIFSPPKKRKAKQTSSKRPQPKMVLPKTSAAKVKSPARYSLRKGSMVKYMSLAVPDEDDFLYCEDCNMEYPGDCPVHGPLVVVEDKQVPEGIKIGENDDYNMYTLPYGLEIKKSKIPDAGNGVFATKLFSARTRFGPYKGTKERNEDVAHDSGYCWQIYQNGKPSHFVDAKDPKNSNWMRYVNCARSEDEQCLTAYQHEGEIYYRAHCDIAVGTELLVYYGDNYAEELGIPLQTVGHLNRREIQKPHNDDIYPCTKCYLAFSTDVFLERHMHRVHNEEYWKMKKEGREWSSQSWKEKECGNVTNCSKSNTTGRVKGDNQENYNSLSNVTEVFSQSGELRVHMRIHTGEKPYKCTVCDKAFSQSFNLQGHMRIHNGEKPYKCTVCDKAFSRSQHLQKHMRIHSGEKPYKCTVCDKAFSQSGDLRVHMRIHNGEKPYKCTVCDKAFSQSQNLQGHMRIHNGEKPYKCTVCDKAFSQSQNLQKHMRIHNGEKPYKCTVCDKAFNQSFNLQGHMRIHNGEKPYKCTVCDKAFSRSQHLQGHMRIHNGEKPYKCTV